MMEKTTGAAAQDPAKKGEEEYKDYAMEAALLEAQQKRQSQGVPGTHEPFPVQLHWVLEQTEKDGLSEVVRWAPHGRAFVVHQRELFVEKVLPVYFNQSKFTSFQRQLSLYGFKRLSKGPDRGGYYHPKFLRISRTFTRNITRTKVKNEGPRKAATPDAEPDFYKMPKLSEAIGRANPSTGVRTLASPGASGHLSTATMLRDQTQYAQSARLGNYHLDASLAYQVARGSPVSSPGVGLPLPSPDLDRNRLLNSRLQNPNDALVQGVASFPSLPTPFPPQLRALNSGPRLPSDRRQGLISQNFAPVSNLLLQSINRPNQQRALNALSTEQALAFGNQQVNEIRVPSPSLSDAVAQILGTTTRNNPSLPPGSESSDHNRDGNRGGGP